MGNAQVYHLMGNHKMFRVGLGTWQAENEEELLNTLEAATTMGYRLIDTAAAYENEEVIGKFLAKEFARKTITRGHYFITTKIWPTNLHPSRQEAALRESLRKLQLNQVDLCLAHMPTAHHPDGTHDPSVTVEDIWRGMEDLVRKGLTKTIGVSNFSIEQMARIKKIAKIPISVAQVECHLYWPQDELVDWCMANKIVVTSYASLGSPSRHVPTLPNGQPMEWASCPNMLEEPAIIKIGERHGKTPAQVLLRWLYDREIGVIPKSTNPQRLEENLNGVVSFHLDDEDLRGIHSVTHRQRLFQQHHMIGHPEDGFKDER